MLRTALATVTLTATLLSGAQAGAATTGELVQREGLRGLLCDNEIPDCICKYFRPDYCKKPLPCPCGPLPPNLSGGCGPKRSWSIFRPWRIGCGSSCGCAGAGDEGGCGDGTCGGASYAAPPSRTPTPAADASPAAAVVQPPVDQAAGASAGVATASARVGR